MRSLLRDTRLIFLTGLLAGLLIGIAADPALRFGLAAFYQDRYADLVFQCDHAMRSHFIARSQAGLHPDAAHATLLAESEVALIDCHDYDMFRKHLLRLGLTEDDLAAMQLEAIERRGQDVREIVRIHEIRY